LGSRPLRSSIGLMASSAAEELKRPARLSETLQETKIVGGVC
jgi:hypothetical protein